MNELSRAKGDQDASESYQCVSYAGGFVMMGFLERTHRWVDFPVTLRGMWWLLPQVRFSEKLL